MSDRERCHVCGKSMFSSFGDAQHMAEHMRRTNPQARRVMVYASRECGGAFHIGEKHAARDGRFKWVQEKRWRKAESAA